MSLTHEDIKILTQPFDKATIGVKVQSFSKDRTKAMLVCYLQHTDVYARLDQVDPCWSALVTNEDRHGDTVFIRLRLTVKGVSRENVGEGQDAKSATSDAIKRAAMLFGVGRYLYDSETVWVPYNEQTDRFKSYTFEDYNKALRHGQTPLPTAGTQTVQTPKVVEPVRGSLKAVIAQDAHVPLKNRRAMGEEIMKVARAIKLEELEMSEWVFNVFNKQMKDLSIPEMEEFLALISKELKQGVPVS